ncbi:hypothetical protein B9479_001545 [Cryptococcus floricola]|uniref:Uncharacterized protein n=1 Tax=Cryptococcus floricola TaxID=2591691 RepID=A0A5D3B560_9TREE|nr:hypothetical protein B9479_001545 [Cryptococcus floricola]
MSAAGSTTADISTDAETPLSRPHTPPNRSAAPTADGFSAPIPKHSPPPSPFSPALEHRTVATDEGPAANPVQEDQRSAERPEHGAGPGDHLATNSWRFDPANEDGNVADDMADFMNRMYGSGGDGKQGGQGGSGTVA